jgi:DnaJ-domain-containing protein 1
LGLILYLIINYGNEPGPDIPDVEHKQSAKRRRKSERDGDSEVDKDELPAEEELYDAHCVQILGLSGWVTMQAVRTAYHQRIKQYHPDNVAHMGPKLRQLAETEAKRINEAYEYFEKKLGSD